MNKKVHLRKVDSYCNCKNGCNSVDTTIKEDNCKCDCGCDTCKCEQIHYKPSLWDKIDDMSNTDFAILVTVGNTLFICAFVLYTLLKLVVR